LEYKRNQPPANTFINAPRNTQSDGKVLYKYIDTKVIGTQQTELIMNAMFTFTTVVPYAFAITLLAGEKQSDVDPKHNTQLTYRKRRGHRRQLVVNCVGSGPGNSNPSFSF